MPENLRPTKGPMPEYGELILTHAHTVVERAGQRVLLALELLRQMRDDVWCSADRIYAGNTRDGDEVIYEITGWDGERKALVLERVHIPVQGRPLGLAKGLVCRACVMGGCTSHPGDTYDYREGGSARD